MNDIKVVVLDNGIDIDSVPLIGNKIYALEVVENSDKQYSVENSVICEKKHGTLIIREMLSDIIYNNVTIYSLKVLEEDLSCNLDKLYFALSYINNFIKPDLINMSLGYQIHSERIYNILQQLISNNTIIVAAYDNEDQSSYPAGYTEVIGVMGNNNIKDIGYYNYDYIKNNIYTYNGLRRINIPNMGYQYISGNSIACSRISAFVINKLCVKKISFYELKKYIIQKSKKIKEKGNFANNYHNKKEKILLYPLNVKTLTSVEKLSAFCNIVGFLDFRNYFSQSVRDRNHVEYPIFQSFDHVPNQLEYIYVHEITDGFGNDKKEIIYKILEGALGIRANVSFFEKPDSAILEEFRERFISEDLIIEYVNILEN